MILGANILLYARNEADPRHAQARAWLEDASNGNTRVGLPWQTLGAFLRISTNHRAFPDPPSPDDAWQQIAAWLDAPRAWIAQPTAQYQRVLGELVHDRQIRGPYGGRASGASVETTRTMPLVSTRARLAARPAQPALMGARAAQPAWVGVRAAQPAWVGLSRREWGSPRGHEVGISEASTQDRRR